MEKTVGEKNMEKFYDEFVGEFGRESFLKMKEKYGQQLKAMNDAESEAEWNRAFGEFGSTAGAEIVEKNVKELSPEKTEILRKTLNAYNSPKNLGSYEEMLKEAVFNKPQWYNKVTTTNEDGTEVVNDKNIALMALMRDQDKLNVAARELGMKPDELFDHVETEWRKYLQGVNDKAQKKAAEDIVANRKKLLEDYENEVLFKVPVVGVDVKRDWAGSIVAPEVTNWAKQAILTGDDSEGLGKAVAKDVAFNVASLAGGVGAAKAGGAIASKATNSFLKGYSPLLVGTGKDALVELGREGLSDYESVDPGKIVETGAAAFTIPTLMKRFGRVGANVQVADKNAAKGVTDAIKTGVVDTSTKLGKIEQGLMTYGTAAGARYPLQQKYDEQKKTEQALFKLFEKGVKPTGERSQEIYNKWRKLYRDGK